jgi:peptidoglycan-N-acetylglucosamine deacetylase
MHTPAKVILISLALSNLIGLGSALPSATTDGAAVTPRVPLASPVTRTVVPVRSVGVGEAHRVRRAEAPSSNAQSAPEEWILEKFGRPPERTITLTFDDGPSAEWTPAVLDILKAEQVPAAFFIVGACAQQRPALVARAWAEGHTLGNHTFSHTDIRTIPPAKAQEEFERGRSAIEKAAGRGVRLFRAPYDADPAPASREQLQPLEAITRDGTIAVGAGVDSQDYNRPGVEQILANVLGPVRRGEARIILFHDAGGDRSQTVEAVRRLIPLLKSEGFTFIGLPEMLGLPRDQLNPGNPAATPGRAGS